MLAQFQVASEAEFFARAQQRVVGDVWCAVEFQIHEWQSRGVADLYFYRVDEDFPGWVNFDSQEFFVA